MFDKLEKKLKANCSHVTQILVATLPKIGELFQMYETNNNTGTIKVTLFLLIPFTSFPTHKWQQ